MPGRRLAVAAAIAACCATLAVAAAGDPPGAGPRAGSPPVGGAQASTVARPSDVVARPSDVVKQLAALPSAAAFSSAEPSSSAAPSPSAAPSSSVGPASAASPPSPGAPASSGTPSPDPASTDPASTDPTSPGRSQPPGAARACGGLPRVSPATLSEIMGGWLTIAPFPAVVIDPNLNGDVNWAMNPFGNPTWGQDFRSGGWIEDLVAAAVAGGPEAAAERARAKQLAAGWLRAEPPSGRDPRTLVCIAQAFGGQAWINDQIPPTVNYYAAHWMGAWNHGLLQDIKLLRIGCGYPAAAFGGDARRWRQTAVTQLVAAFEPNPLGPAIDAQGAVNEQATLYENFVYTLWQTALPELAACGYRLPGWITARVAKIPSFLAAATEPDGNLAQIGDSYLERPATAAPGDALVSVYSQAGYVFGRSGWTPAASFYSLRFGPGRQIHGHNDHLGITYYAQGRDLIVDAGHDGYAATPYRAWLQSPEAASTLVLPGVPFNPDAATALTADRIGRSGQFYELSDTAFDGDPRSRSVYVSQQPNLMLVFDRAVGGSAASAYQQLWHLDPDLTVTEVGAGYAIASAPGTELTLARVALPGQVIAPGSTEVAVAQSAPYQGWVSRQMLQRTPADTVTMTSAGPAAAILTLLVPTAPSTPVAYSVSGPAAGPWTLRVTVGATASVYTITADGVIS